MLHDLIQHPRKISIDPPVRTIAGSNDLDEFVKKRLRALV